METIRVPLSDALASGGADAWRAHWRAEVARMGHVAATSDDDIAREYATGQWYASGTVES